MQKMLLLIFGCINCNKSLQSAISSSAAYPNLPVMLSAFIVLSVIVAISAWLSARPFEITETTIHRVNDRSYIPLTAASIVLGIAMGSFFDGIIFHDILQWHGMLTNKVAADTLLNKSVNVFWDGIFYGFTWVVALIGIYLLWQLLQRPFINRSGALLLGGMFSGWGIFNFVEGLINHHILGLHNVRELTTDRNSWNYGFLICSILLMLLGCLLIRKGKANKVIFRKE